jgi:Asp-tRNA(Asn)/Glu-tRNA(Gln) amidotransferase A subunit family amidase
LPVGVQLIGAQMSDSQLLAIAEAVSPIIDSDPGAALRG